MPLGKAKNGQRDFEILKAALAGVSLASLASEYNLTAQRVQAILTVQRHKLAVSPSIVYRSLRQADNHGSNGIGKRQSD